MQINLEKAFSLACEQHDQLKLLESQWRFDKELISKALQNIGSIFSHYSRHDSSHSRQIIVNIERMLGEKIYDLTATDMWLILESAYQHDIGMVITKKQIEDLGTKEFEIYVKAIAGNKEHELFNFAKKWLNGEANLPNGVHAYDFFDEFKQLLAEWYRKKHPFNANKIINSPLDEIGLSSPRNELLPKRLFKVLGKICESHGCPFDSVLELPFSEAGMGTEDCHPRFVSALLRMGDLLDVDDNRFCPVMMRMSNQGLPATSQAHFEKHQSIQHLRLDRERIKIDVSCPTPESYEAAHDWFSWLEKEYHQQSQHWHKIVPDLKLGRLPTLSPPVVKIDSPFLILQAGKKPRFTVSDDKILKMLRGTGLYKSKTDCIREILQNAVDSTLLFIWSQHKKDIINAKPESSTIKEIYSKFSISVTIEKVKNEKGLLKVIIKDDGMGISKDDLNYIMNIGSASENIKKKNVIDEMPDWFKPSGNFGIGLQSIFLMTESFSFTTRSRATDEAFHVLVSSDKNKSIIIKKINKDSIEYGATFILDIKVDSFPKTISLGSGSDGVMFKEILNNYDFTDPNSDLRDYDELKLLQEIERFNSGSPIKVRECANDDNSASFQGYSGIDNKVVLVGINFKYNQHSNYTQALFKGQPIKGAELIFPFVDLLVNFCGYSASDFLTYNREAILPDMKTLARSHLKKCINEYIDDHFHTLENEQKPFCAAFYLYNNPIGWFRDEYEKHLSALPVVLNRSIEETLAEVVTKIKDGTYSKFIGHYHELFDFDNSEVISINSNVLEIIKVLLTKEGMYWQEQTNGIANSNIVYWSHDDIQPTDDKILESILTTPGNMFDMGNRILFPSWGDYKELSVKTQIEWARIHYHTSYKNEYLVLPYKFDHLGNRHEDLSENFILWVFENRNNEKTSIESIETLYKRLIIELESKVLH